MPLISDFYLFQTFILNSRILNPIEPMFLGEDEGTMRRKIIGIFVVGILLFTGFISVPNQAGPALQPLTSPDPQIIDMIQQVNESLLFDYASHLTAFGIRFRGSENCFNASQYIYDEFQMMGLAVEFHNWTFDGLTDRNVVATLSGADPSSNATFIMCAHHDTIRNSSGADDDGSGVAAVLAIAKILSQYLFKYTIRFITVSAEEGGLYGSYMYAREASQRGDNIVGVINADEIGIANTTEGGRTLPFLYLEQSKWLGDFVTIVSTLYRNQTNMTAFPFPYSFANSDYKSFVNYGFDAIFAAEYDYNYSKANTEYDTLNRINWMYLTKATKLLLAVVAELASTPIELQVMITTPIAGYVYLFNNPFLPLTFKRYPHLPMFVNDFIFDFRGTTFILGTANLNADVIPYNNIEYVYVCIDGDTYDWQIGASPHYQWVIPGGYLLFFGFHKVKIIAFDMSGNVASDEMNIILY
jgi:hypothetical protein